MFVERAKENPILTPNRYQSWEAKAVFNGCPVKKNDKIYLLYRALSLPHYHHLAKTSLMVSNVSIAESKDGVHFSNRRRFIIPEYDWERFGCEDPRVTKLGNKYFIFYTALSSWPPQADFIRVGVAISDNLEKIKEKHLVTSFNAKAMALFPEKIGGKIYGILTVNTDKPPAKICIVSFNKENEIWSQAFWEKWYQKFDSFSLELTRSSKDHLEVGAPPLKTKKGWLLLYSYIQDYFTGNPLFTIEAVLLDLKNPYRILARTRQPLLVPEEYYETIGLVPNTVFPSGAIIQKGRIYLYYGAADTTCCLAFIELETLLSQMIGERKAYQLLRFKGNPIITPIKEHPFESKLTFNPGALYLKGRVHLLYRAVSDDNTSSFGYATSKDGFRLDYRSPEPVYVPREPFEKKLMPGGYSGCEDPRLTKIGNRIYLLYTAFDGKNSPRVALSSIKESDFLQRKWNWAKPVLISPPNLADKDACLFPQKFKDNYLIIHRVGDDIDYAFCSSLDFKEGEWLEEQRWITPRPGMWDSEKVGVAAPPLKTDEGWLLFYHGVDKFSVYRVGVILLDLKNPLKILARSLDPLLEPKEPYEKEGEVANVVFPCGAVIIKERIFVYYGGADKVVGVATIKVKDLLNYLKSCRC